MEILIKINIDEKKCTQEKINVLGFHLENIKSEIFDDRTKRLMIGFVSTTIDDIYDICNVKLVQINNFDHDEFSKKVIYIHQLGLPIYQDLYQLFRPSSIEQCYVE